MEATAPFLGVNDGDYPPVKTFRELKDVVWSETVKTWAISGPVIFQIVCQYGTNSVTNIFVGQLGEIELSGVSIAISVIATFAFGFMVCIFCLFLLLCLIISLFFVCNQSLIFCLNEILSLEENVYKLVVDCLTKQLKQQL